MTLLTRRRLAGAALLVWLPLGLAWALIWPDNPEDTRAVLASAAAHPGAWELAASIFALSFLLAVPGLAAVPSLVAGRRGGRLATAGAVLAIAGFIGDVVAGCFSILLPVLAGQPDRDRMIGIWDTVGGRPALAVVAALILLGHLGLVLMAFGLFRSGIVGRWMPAVVTAGMLVETVVGTAGHASVATVLLTGAGLAGLARILLSPGRQAAVVAAEPMGQPAIS